MTSLPSRYVASVTRSPRRRRRRRTIPPQRSARVADRVAEQLAVNNPDFRYANLAIRGRLLGPIIDEQLEPALALKPDLVTIYAAETT